MVCIDDDNWDLMFSVGVIVIIVVVGCVLVIKDLCGLINDLFVEFLVCVVGLDLFIKMMDGEFDMLMIVDVLLVVV